MTVAALIRKFSQHYTAIEVDDVIAELRARGIMDEIYYFWDQAINPGRLGGFIEHWDYDVEGEARRCATITYARTNNELERLVCTKETLHILDPAHALVADEAAIDHLMDRIILPPDTVDPTTEGVSTISDRIAVAQALAILFPYNARSVLLPAFKAKTLRLEHVAEIMELPPRYTAVVLNDLWEDIHGLLVA